MFVMPMTLLYLDMLLLSEYIILHFYFLIFKKTFKKKQYKLLLDLDKLTN